MIAALSVALAACLTTPGDEPIVVTRRAMAVKFQVALVDPDARALDAVLSALDEVDAIEQRVNVWSPDSDVSRWNDGEHTEPVAVPADVVELVAAARAMGARTDGAFDVTVAPLFALWGLDARQLRDPSADEIAATRACVGADELVVQRDPPRLGRSARCVRVDLSAAAKGFAVARVVERLRAAGVTDAFVAAGSSTVYALGDGPDDDGWPFDVAPGVTWRLVDRAVATSGSSETDLVGDDGRVVRHILDPRTGRPAERHVTMAVFVGPDPLEADMASTSLVVLGEDGAAAWAEAERWSDTQRGARLVLTDGRTVEVGDTPAPTER